MPNGKKFKGRRLCIATMHGKESVIAPVLELELGVETFVAEGFDTDAFGNFSGEVARLKSPLETARQKCLKAIDITGCDLVVASEGSFGPDPVSGFLPSDEEILLFCDARDGLEIAVKELSLKTNFGSRDIYSFEELAQFARQSLFPEHGLLLKDKHGALTEKGIRSWNGLQAAFDFASARGFPVAAETDMRAHQNPTRMDVIRACAEKLVKAIQSECPVCARPGFVVTSAETGLPCEHCAFPTRSTLKYVYACKGCGHSQEQLFPHGKKSEDPMYCDNCNP